MALAAITLILILTPSVPMQAQPADSTGATADTAAVLPAADSLQVDSTAAAADLIDIDADDADDAGWHQTLKTKFIDGNAAFMSLVALVLILGLTLCIERIIYLTLAEVDSRKLLKDIDQKVSGGDIEGARELCSRHAWSAAVRGSRSSSRWHPPWDSSAPSSAW